MRRLGPMILILAAAALPAAALSQEDTPRSAEDYVCAFAGDCPDKAADETAPGERPRLEADRGFSLSPPAATRPRRPAPTARGQRRAPSGSGAAVAPRRPAAAQGQRVNLRLSFETGSDKLTPAAEAEARTFARALLLPQLVNMRFRIEGHTDSVGGRAMNLDLSQRRAESVADFLIGLGVARDRLEVRGYGPDRPMPGTRASAGENRRVEAVRIS